jgi:hypothetical protein
MAVGRPLHAPRSGDWFAPESVAQPKFVSARKPTSSWLAVIDHHGPLDDIGHLPGVMELESAIPRWWGSVSPLGDKGDCVDLDACPKQNAGNLDCARWGRIMWEDLAADL